MISGFVIMLSVVVIALVACGVANFFVDRKSALIAGFAFSIGSVGTFTLSSEQSFGQISDVIGAVIGLLLVRYLFFREDNAIIPAKAKANADE